ncbi:DUF4129 domain-containing protein [Mucilaginibacter sp. UR6-11]|uniref:DUF4129 domain-containing protein n=1 Tax=Mucilaginibacter sp. UR6-11 TaxID=1435644 RepID=UPI001E657CED|nr:DUF4129 domain-containing protein [Mucilaginibacter sp. UR6-11]MCC8425204.1 DUF4129 domain-containing protein [Mucilaginibacter sp. UR6-11]
MLRYLFLTCFSLLVSLTAGLAAPAKQVKVKMLIKTDSSAISVRHFDSATLNQYRAKKEFHFTKDSYVEESLWDRFWTWLRNLFRLKNKQGAGELFNIIIKYGFIVLGLAALIFLIFKLIGVDAFNVIKGRSASAPLLHDESVEDIYTINFDAEVEKAVNQQNYRFAVRLMYLRVLKQLSDAGQIHWELNKTNSIYVNELTNAEQRLAFKLLTRQFEYIWYGELIIDAAAFKKINALFDGFKIKMA